MGEPEVSTEKQSPRNVIGKGKPGPGRKKGIPNKSTALLKDAILMAAGKAGGKDGLVGYLVTQARDNPTSFLPLLGKVLPLQVVGENDGPISIQIVRFSDEG